MSAKNSCPPKRGKKEDRSYFRSPQKYECHSHIAPFDKKEWHFSFALNFGSGTQESGAQKSAALVHIGIKCILKLKI